MTYTYKIWDKTSPINKCDAGTAMQSLGIKETDEVYIILDSNGNDWMVQTQDNAPYKGASIDESAQNHINALVVEQALQKKRLNSLLQKIELPHLKVHY